MRRGIKYIIRFLNFLFSFFKIERRTYLPDSLKKETDVEHSYQLAMMAWYIIDVYKLSLNREKIIMYALAHDLVETYAGDTFFFIKKKKHLLRKHQKEERAFKKIKASFPAFKSLHTAISSYEKRKDPEAKFIYSLDKLIPILTDFMDHGRSWQLHHITYKMVRAKDPKIALSPDVQKIWSQLIPLLRKHLEYFGARRRFHVETLRRLYRKI